MESDQGNPSSWIEPADRRFAVRSFAAAALLFVVATFFAFTWRFFERKFYITTGEAQWIWVTDPMSKERPVAFFATRDFDVPEGASEVKINVAADPSYTLWFNGSRVGVGASHGSRIIRMHDVTALRRRGKNRIVVACRASRGAGGLLLSVDFGRMQRNGLFTDRRWHIFRHWSDDLLARDPAVGGDGRVRSFGSPPVGRWNYPEREVAAEETDPDHPLQPVGVESFEGRVPETRILSGIAVASARRVPARAFDFGAVEGHARISREPGAIEVIRIRYANAPEELAAEGEIVPIVFAAGESSAIDASRRDFRYVVVYGDIGSVTVEPLRR